MMKSRISVKLTLLFCLAGIVAMLAGYFFLTSHLKAGLDKNLYDTLKKELFFARDMVGRHELAPDASVLAQQMGRGLGVRVTVVGGDGAVAGDSDIEPSLLRGVENHGTRPEILDAKTNGFGTSQRFSTTIRKRMLYMAVPLKGGPEEGFLRFAVPMADIAFLKTQWQKTVGIGIMIIFVFSLGLIAMISVFISRPLTEMAGIARDMARGNFSRKPLVAGRDEIAELARALGDMSEEIKAKIERVRQEGAKLDAVLSSMIEGVMVTDAKGAVMLMNPSLRKLFFVETAPEGKNVLEVVRHNEVQDVVDRILKGAEGLAGREIVLSQPDGKVLQVNAVPITRQGVPEGVVCVFHDITELRRLEQMRQDFVANVSHELRTPVASIKGYAETLLDGALNDPLTAREFVEVIHQSSNRLSLLIDDLLDLSKIESGKMKLAFSPLAAVPLVDRCLGILEKQIRDKKLKITKDIPESLPQVMAEEKGLMQILLNLLDNAVKYTPDGGQIRVSAVPEGAFVHFDIVDTGTGIPEKDIPRVFERFYRVDKARSRDQGGTGLGLSIVKHIVGSHGGQVWVASTLGHGSAFSFTIPIAGARS